MSIFLGTYLHHWPNESLFFFVLYYTKRYFRVLAKTHASFVSLIDFLGKVKKNSMGKVLSVPLDEVLKSQITLFLVLVVSERHFQSVIQCLYSLHTLSITPAITCLIEAEKDSEALLNETSVNARKNSPLIVFLITLILVTFLPLALLFAQGSSPSVLSLQASCTYCPGCRCLSCLSLQGRHSNPNNHPNNKNQGRHKLVHCKYI